MDIIIQYNYYNYLDYIDYISLLLTNKTFYYNSVYSNDFIYKFYLQKKFSQRFIVLSRPIIMSYKDCFYRIVTFEKRLINLGYKIWEEDTYYMYWKMKNLIELKDNIKNY